MTVKSHFNLHGAVTGNENEQSLIQGLVTEAIQQYGMDVVYLPRTMQKEDTLFHEDVLSSFSTTYTIEMYVENAEGFEGEGDMLMNFGLRINDQIELSVSRERFVAETGMTKPMEGDLIHFPLSGSLFEVKFVEHENQFYPAGTLPRFVLRCELFDYAGEQFSTGITDIDDIETSLDAVDPYANNTDIQNEATQVVDWSEQNPFGTG